MAANCFAIPILPGKTDAWKRAMAELSGPRKADFDDWNRRWGITRNVAALQQTPDGAFVVVFTEGAQPGTTERVLPSDHPFDKWFVETVLTGIHGVEPDEEPPPDNEVFIDWSG